VLLMRTLSKFGLAGVRIGYMMGPQALIAEVDKVRPPYNISVLNSEARCSRWSTRTCSPPRRPTARASARACRRAGAMPGVKAWPSDANMILVRVPDPARAFEGMKARGGAGQERF
jgi:histidinol-phosphate aminotransferase